MKKIYLLIMMLTSMFLGSSMRVNAQSDSELIMSRIRAKLAPSKISVVESTVATYLPTMQTDGSWSDINYQDVVFEDGWQPKTHNERLLAFAQAYVLNSTYKGNTQLFAAIEKGLNHYYQVNPTTTHWWTKEIEAPQMILSTLIFLRAGVANISATLENNILNRFDALPEPTKHDIGANRSDVALWHLYQALLRNNAVQLTYASEHLFNSFVTTLGNGIQHDYSYMDHGPQLNTYSYGVVLMNNTNKAANYLVGTPYAMPAQYLDVYSNFLKTAYSTCLRGKYVSYSTLGRSISRPNQVLKYAGAFSEAQTIDPANAVFYTNVVERAKGTVPVGYAVTPTYTHYYRSKFSTHNREGYYFSVLTASNRTEKTETGNGENLKGLFLADGATNFMVRGDEYYNIFPVWDWTKIPGVTAPEYANTMPAGTWGTPGTSVFTGGVSNGSYGAHVFAMSDYSTQAKKAWFCFDEEIVCLGAGVTSSAAETINTTVNQCILKGNVTVSQNNVTSVVTVGSSQVYNNNLDWVLHDQVGYFFPSGGMIKLGNQTQAGSWKEINNLQSATPVSQGVFKLWFDHGVKPQNNAYVYIVAPGKSTVSDMQAYNLNNLVILSNTNDLQAVQHKALDMIQVVFYRAGSLSTNGITIQADKPCALVLANVSSPTVSVSISDPGESSSLVNIGFESPQIAGLRHLPCTLPVSIEEAGKSVHAVIDIHTPEAPVNNGVIAVEDAFVRGGTYANTSYPAGDLVCKLTPDASFTRFVYLKFDVSSLAGKQGTARLRLNLTNTEVNTFGAYYVNNDNWSETSLTWNNMPASTTALGTVTNDASGIIEWDITDQLMTELTGDKILTIKIEPLASQAYSAFYSRDAALQSLKPAIVFNEATTIPGADKVTAQHDAFVRGGTYANTNYNLGYLVTKLEANAAYTRETFLKFDLAQFNAQSGRYLLNLHVNSGNTNTWKVWFIANDNWTENTLTWNNMPAETSLIGTFSNTTSIFQVDITDQVLTELAGDKQLTIKVASAVNVVYAGFASKEDADALKHPVIQYEQVLKSGSVNIADDLNDGNKAVSVFPNPVNDIFYISNVQAGAFVSVYSLAGQLLKSEDYQSGVNISHLQKGIYIVQVRANEQIKSFKLEKR